MIVDIHAHLDHKDIDIPKVLSNAEKSGVSKIFTSGINPHTNRIALELAEKYEIVEASLGIYPIEALKKEIETGEYPLPNESFDIDEEIDFIRKKNPLVIGEVGMDRAMVTDKDKEQAELFQKMIDLAEELNKPLIIHSRKAEAQIVDILESSSIKKVIMHCFMGKKKLVKRISDNGWMFSVPPNITRSQQFQIIADEVPLSQLLTETDAPYLSPYKDQLNEPAFITETIKMISKIKQLEYSEVEKNLYMNYQKNIL